jgi:hypothetical protein
MRKFIIGHKDVDKELMNYLNDRDILNMLINKNYDELLNEKFFHHLFLRRYPYLLKFKPKNKSYRKHYVDYTYYINNLKEEGIPYISNPNYDPKKITKGRWNSWERIFYYVTTLPDSNYKRELIDLFYPHMKDLRWGLFGAIETDNLDLAKEILTQDDKNGHLSGNLKEAGLNKASEYGKINIMNYFLDIGGSLRLAFIASLRPKIFYHTANYLIQNYHPDISIINEAFQRVNTKEKIDYLISLGANNFNGALIHNVSYINGEKLIDYLVNLGANNLNEAVRHSISPSIIAKLVSLGANPELIKYEEENSNNYIRNTAIQARNEYLDSLK